MKGGQELRVLGAHARVALGTELAYRSNFWTYLVNSIVALGLSLGSIALVYRHVDEVGGWTAADLLVVVGVFFLLGGVVNGVIHMSMAKLAADIRYGDFDYRLLKPVDAQVVALGQQPDPWRMLDSPVGAVVLVVAISRGGLADAPGGAVGALGAAGAMFACALVICAAFWALLASITFWTVQGEGILWALDDMYDHLRWPITIFPDGLRLALMTVFPAGLAVTVPAQALTGRLDWESASIALALAAGLALMARLVWLRALRRYEGASA